MYWLSIWSNISIFAALCLRHNLHAKIWQIVQIAKLSRINILSCAVLCRLPEIFAEEGQDPSSPLEEVL